MKLATMKLGRYGFAIYTNYGVASGMGGTSYGPIIFIRPQWVNDRGLLEHEFVHTRQWWRWFGFSHTFMTKLEREIEAYKEQIKWYPDDRTAMFSRFLATRYGLDITAKEVERLLRAKG